MLLAWNATRESGSFCGDQLCALKTAYLFAQNVPGVDEIVVALSPANEMHFLFEKFIDNPRGDGGIPKCKIVYDNFNPGDWPARWEAWDKWRAERQIEGIKFDEYRELYLRIHGAQRQTMLCGSERGIGRRNIYSYWWCGQEGCPEELPPSVDWFDDSLIYHPDRKPTRDVYIAPHAKTQGNFVFTFDYWANVVRRLVDNGVSVTVGYDGFFCPELDGNPLFRRHWGDHKQWMAEVCEHKLVVCGNTGTGWLAAACGVPMITMEPHNSCMSDHRYRECGLRNIVEVIDGHKLDELHNDMTATAEYCARRITEEVHRCVVMTTGCYDVIHAGHVRHLERSRTLGTRLIVALNSDKSVRELKGPDRPINPQDQRKAVLEALRCVDEVVVTDDTTASIILRHPDVITNGFGYTLDTVKDRALVEGWGGKAVVTCTGDASREPSTTKVVRKVRSAEIADVCRAAAAYSVNPFDKLKLMAEQLLLCADVQGDVADLGACRGGTSLVLRRLAPDKCLHLFDTWEGNPYDDPLCHHKKGEWVASLEDCQRVVGNGDLTTYHNGVFPKVTKGAEAVRFCFVYVDSDTYQSVHDAIEFFWPRLSRGGRIVFDDYNWEPCAGVKKAVDEMFPLRSVDDDSYAGLPGNWHRVVVESAYACILEKR